MRSVVSNSGGSQAFESSLENAKKCCNAKLQEEQGPTSRRGYVSSHGRSVCVSLLLWRIHHSVRAQKSAYVDDLNFIAGTQEDLCRVLELAVEPDDFRLVLSRQKTCLWGTSLHYMK